MKKIFLVAGLFLIIILIVEFVPNLSGDYIKTGKLYISEIMASNYSTILDDDKEYSDYIEIYNGYKTKINLYGYYLSDEEFDIRKWSFPDIDINPGEYLIIYASGKDKCDTKERICHTNFKLSSEGEVLTLIDNTGNIISKFTYPKMETDVSYGYKNGKYMLFDKATPGGENNSKKFKTINNNAYSNISINEYMTDNSRVYYDKYGNYYDWVELYNSSNKDINLQNVFITDDESNLNKYKIKDVVIKAKGYLIVHMPGEKVNYEDGIYTDFGLSSNDKKIIISNGKKKIDEVEIVYLKENVSYGKVDNTWKYFTSPTPGSKNNTKGFDSLGGLNGNS